MDSRRKRQICSAGRNSCEKRTSTESHTIRVGNSPQTLESQNGRELEKSGFGLAYDVYRGRIIGTKVVPLRERRAQMIQTAFRGFCCRLHLSKGRGRKSRLVRRLARKRMIEARALAIASNDTKRGKSFYVGASAYEQKQSDYSSAII